MVNDGKVCKKCSVFKELSLFRFNKNKYEGVCKKCAYLKTKKITSSNNYKEKQREKYSQNKDNINSKRRSRYKPRVRKARQSKEEKNFKNKQWRLNNKDKRKAAIKKYNDTHKSKAKEYRLNNKEKILKRIKEYQKDNKSKHNSWLKKRRLNPEVKLKHNISCIIRFYIKKHSGKKDGTFIKYLDYSISELFLHIEKQFDTWMTWNNHGLYIPSEWNDDDISTWKWQLDHIVPQSDLPYSSMEDENFKKCWALNNLRPYSAKLNVIEGSNRTRHNKEIENAN